MFRVSSGCLSPRKLLVLLMRGKGEEKRDNKLYKLVVSRNVEVVLYLVAAQIGHLVNKKSKICWKLIQ